MVQMNTIRIRFLLMGLFALFIASVVQAQPEHAKVLGRYIGSWQLTYSDKPEEIYTEKYEWILNGTFIRKATSPSTDASKMLTMQMMQFDNGKGVYRGVTFTSGGSVLQAEGSWNGASKMLTWTTADASGKTTRIKATVVDADTDKISIVTTDAAGKVVSERNGERKRHK
jgi:hypothetical protein